MSGRRLVGGGRRGGGNGVSGRRDGGGGGGRRDNGVNRRVVGGNNGDGRRHSNIRDVVSGRNGDGASRRNGGGNNSGAGGSDMRGDGRRHGNISDESSRRNGGSGSGDNNMGGRGGRSLDGSGASGSQGMGGKSVSGGSGGSRLGGSSRASGSIGANVSNVGGGGRGWGNEQHLNDGRGGRSLDGSGASGNQGMGGKSVSGGSGGSRLGGSSRAGGSIGANVSNVGGGRRGWGNEQHLNNEIYDASSEDSDYEPFNDEFNDDLGGSEDEDLVDSEDEDLSGSEDEDLGGSENEGDGGSEDEGDGDSEYDVDEGDGGSEYEVDEVERGDREGGDREGGDREGSEDDEEVTAQHNRRGYSLGLFGHPPDQPIRIRMIGRVIDSPVACRTLLALMRVHWPAGCIGAKDVDRRFPRWWSRIRKMFFRYYTFDPKHGTKNEAREALNKHMRRNMRKTLCNERKRIKNIIKKNGGSFIDYRPPYYSEAVWKPICDHWESPTFQKRSDAAKEAREHQKIPHTSGAISFQRRAWDIREKTGKDPKRFELFVRLHTKDKENKEFTSEVVRMLVEQYLAKCKEHNEDPLEAPIDTWVEVVGVRKNTIIGIPRVDASELIPLPPTSGKRRRRRNVDEESGGSTGRSVIEHMADDLVMQAVDRTVAFARANPDEFGLAPEQVNTLAQSVAEGRSDLPSDHPLTMTTMRELVQVMVSVLGDVYGTNFPSSNCNNKGKSIVREDEHHSDDDDGQLPPTPRRSGSRSGNRSGSLQIRGD